MTLSGCYDSALAFGRKAVASAKRKLPVFFGGGAAVGAASAVHAQEATVTIPTAMEPVALVTAALDALGPLVVPLLTLVAVVGLMLGVIGFVWKVSRRGGRGG
jgi:hypothetical protein